MRTSEEQKIIQDDQLQNPGCGYSTSYSQSCRNINGDLTCETIRRILRSCPNKAPVEIYSNTTATNEDRPFSNGGLANLPPFAPSQQQPPFMENDEENLFFGKHGDSNPFAILQEMMKPFGEIFSGNNEDDFFGGKVAPQMPDHPSSREEERGADRERKGWFFGGRRAQQKHNNDDDEEERHSRSRGALLPAPHHFPRGKYAPENDSAAGEGKGMKSEIQGKVEEI